MPQTQPHLHKHVNAQNNTNQTTNRKKTALLDAVASLRAALRAMGSDLVIRAGPSDAVVAEFAANNGVDAILAEREVEARCALKPLSPPPPREGGLLVAAAVALLYVCFAGVRTHLFFLAHGAVQQNFAPRTTLPQTKHKTKTKPYTAGSSARRAWPAG
jgi:hypothetical protein